MKKIFLTMTLFFATLIVSAQFIVVTNINQPADDAEWEVSNFTDNIGIGYQLNDDVTIGAIKNGDDYDLFGRYIVNQGIYALVQAPTEDAIDNLNVGIGYSLSLWNAATAMLSG